MQRIQLLLIAVSFTAAPMQIANAGLLTTLSWAKAVNSSSNVRNPSEMLGAPDGIRAGFFLGTPAEAVVSGFGSGDISGFDSQVLSAFLGTTETALLGARFIVFEHNGIPGLPFESSTWTFEDGMNSIEVVHDANTPDPADRIVGSGNISTGNYSSFFGFVDPIGIGDIPFLMFDLSGLLLPTISMTVQLSAQGVGGSALLSPDVDAMALITPIPEPSSIILFVVALGIFVCIRRRT